jgi:hypothetical protein
MSNANLQVLDCLSSKGVEFTIQDMGSHYPVGPEEIEEFLDDPDALFAKFNEVTKFEYRDWREARGRVCCSATTRNGKPCSLPVKGRNVCSSVQEWLSHRGEYCPTHSEGAAASVRGLPVRV